MPLTCHRTIMLKVYIDESGIHDGSPVVTVGAYLARPKQWAAFTEEWSRAIKPINVYRAADAASCRGEFKGWSKVEVAALAERVLPIIPKHTELAMAAGINLRDYAAALKGRDHLRRQGREQRDRPQQPVVPTLQRRRKAPSKASVPA